MEGKLHGVFELTECLLDFDHRIEARRLRYSDLKLSRTQLELIGGACFDHRFDGLDVLVLRLEQSVELSQLLLGGSAGGQRAVDLAD